MRFSMMNNSKNMKIKDELNFELSFTPPWNIVKHDFFEENYYSKPKTKIKVKAKIDNLCDTKWETVQQEIWYYLWNKINHNNTYESCDQTFKEKFRGVNRDESEAFVDCVYKVENITDIFKKNIVNEFLDKHPDWKYVERWDYNIFFEYYIDYKEKKDIKSCEKEEYYTYLYKKYMDSKWIKNLKYIYDFVDFPMEIKESKINSLLEQWKISLTEEKIENPTVIIPVWENNLEQMWTLESIIYWTFVIVAWIFFR